MIKSTSLKVLDLSGNKITSTGGRIIGNAVRYNNFIRKLYLSNNTLNDLAGHYLLESLRINPSIIALEVQYNTISHNIIR